MRWKRIWKNIYRESRSMLDYNTAFFRMIFLVPYPTIHLKLWSKKPFRYIVSKTEQHNSVCIFNSFKYKHRREVKTQFCSMIKNRLPRWSWSQKKIVRNKSPMTEWTAWAWIVVVLDISCYFYSLLLAPCCA